MSRPPRRPTRTPRERHRAAFIALECELAGIAADPSAPDKLRGAAAALEPLFASPAAWTPAGALALVIAVQATLGHYWSYPADDAQTRAAALELLLRADARLAAAPDYTWTRRVTQ